MLFYETSGATFIPQESSVLITSRLVLTVNTPRSVFGGHVRVSCISPL